MKDPRINNLAKILVRYSIDARRGETVGVSGGSAAEPLMLAICEELLKAGAFPVVRMAPEGLAEATYRLGRPHHFTTLTPYQRAYARCVDKTIGIHSETNTRALSNADPRKQAQLSRTLRPISNVLQKKPWALTLFPTAAYAQDADMSFEDFEDFVYRATHADRSDPVAAWKKLHRYQARLIARLRGVDRVRIVGAGTDLSLSVKGRTFINSDGHHNMPSGEIFTGPVEDSAEGVIEFDFPVCRSGREIEGIRLVFRRGKVVEASARKNESFLKTMLKTDAGASRLGELGIGTNTSIRRFTRNILFDEKIGGTVHLAVGQSYPETGGKNQSALHWDMIKDLRKGGTILVNGRAFQKDGRFL